MIYIYQPCVDTRCSLEDLPIDWMKMMIMMMIRRDWSHGRYLLWFAVYGNWWTDALCINTLCVIRKPQKWMCNVVESRKLILMNHDTTKVTKIFCCAKGKRAIDPISLTKCFEIFFSGSKCINDQGKTQNSESVLQAKGKIRWGTNGEYQASSAYHNLVWFMTLSTSAKTSGAAESWPRVIKILQNFWLTLVSIYKEFFFFDEVFITYALKMVDTKNTQKTETHFVTWSY